MVTTPQGRELLRIARSALNAYFGFGNEESAVAVLAVSGAVGGLFVTLEHDEELRGCIGFLRSDDPLDVLARRAAVAAAVADPRFDRVTEDELDGLRITITVLAPAERIENPIEVEVGRHGLIVERGGLRGLLLPTVAAERRWDRERFLAETCRKAGLAADSWKRPDTVVFRFEAESFRESHLTT